MIQQRDTGAYKRDNLADFEATGDLIDLSLHDPDTWREVLRDEIKTRHVGGLVQVGAFQLYSLLGFLKQDVPSLRIADLIYNPIGHVVRHFLYEGAIDRVFVESDYMRGVIRASTRRPDRCIDVLHSGIDLDAFRPAPASAQPLTLGFIGRFSEEKGPLDFVTLAETLVVAGSSAHFAVFGSGPMETEMRIRCQTGAARHRIVFHGYISDVRDAFGAVDILVLPSRTDGRPVAVMEAGASGVPVIGSPVGGIPEMIADGVNGWIAGPGDVERISALIAELHHSPSRLASLRASARAYAESHFNEDLMLDTYAEAFRGLARVERAAAHLPDLDMVAKNGVPAQTDTVRSALA
ncbi:MULTISPECIES: glycosyltransferase [unclassified Aureimonas]|uniref:glycosyltransferase n=1 Tax=unclassified Aureimonas TaxID=2615206 RepID=UPI00138F5B08|nr:MULTISPECIES: glycosyltransferase [unclassified Aureimonas]